MENKIAKPSGFKVLMFPWLGYGHIYPFLQLAKQLVTKKNCHIYFCSTKINLNFIKRTSQSNDSIELVELHLQDSPDLPPHYHTTKDLPPHLLSNLLKAFQAAKTSFGALLEKLSPDLLIFDDFQPWAPVLATEKCIPAVKFMTTGAAATSYFLHLQTRAKSPFPFPSIFFRGYEMRKLQALVESNKDAAEDLPFTGLELSADIFLIKSCRKLEGKYLDHLSLLYGKQLVTSGPLVRESVPSVSHTEVGSPDVVLNTSGDLYRDTCKDIIMSFLNSKPESSVVFVSFGSEYFLSEEEREEMAHGLELSNVSFIWVVRTPPGQRVASIEEALPLGFLDRIKNKGLVVENWAPQAEILGHKGTAGFVSHCGWGSVMESLYFGVPIIAMPVHLDQPINARLLGEIGAGLEVLRHENGNMERGRVADAIRKVVFEEGGNEIREKVKGMGEMLRLKGGDEEQEAVEKIWDLCRKYEDLRNGKNK